ncbi:MAG: 50S ribosomal protein L6 [Dehalococcoidia bacterium]|nr:50S ribosomal protein L6 [Dehalococcoidia bacterium]
MSRIGNKPIPVPASVEIDISGSKVSVRGSKGELEASFNPDIRVELDEGTLRVFRPNDDRRYKALHGLTRALLANMVHGVTDGFRKDMELVGVGYRVLQNGANITLQLGYSHPIEVEAPPGITFTVSAATRMAVEGIDKQLVGEVAAKIRRYRPPEPYKGKGVRYAGEVVRRKAGKSGKIGSKKGR